MIVFYGYKVNIDKEHSTPRTHIVHKTYTKQELDKCSKLIISGIEFSYALNYLLKISTLPLLEEIKCYHNRLYRSDIELLGNFVEERKDTLKGLYLNCVFYSSNKEFITRPCDVSSNEEPDNDSDYKCMDSLISKIQNTSICFLNLNLSCYTAITYSKIGLISKPRSTLLSDFGIRNLYLSMLNNRKLFFKLYSHIPVVLQDIILSYLWSSRYEWIRNESRINNDQLRLYRIYYRFQIRLDYNKSQFKTQNEMIRRKGRRRYVR